MHEHEEGEAMDSYCPKCMPSRHVHENHSVLMNPAFSVKGIQNSQCLLCSNAAVFDGTGLWDCSVITLETHE